MVNLLRYCILPLTLNISELSFFILSRKIKNVICQIVIHRHLVIKGEVCFVILFSRNVRKEDIGKRCGTAGRISRHRVIFG